MSFSEWSNKKKKKEQEEERQELDPRNYNSFTEWSNAKYGVSVEDIAPVVSVAPTTTSKESKEKDSWFQKSGLFDDGYQFGDVTKAILGSAQDVDENIWSGVLGMGEKVVDALAYIAPYAMKAQYNNADSLILDQNTQKAVDYAFNEAQKANAGFIAKDLYDEEKVAKWIVSNTSAVGVNNKRMGVDVETDSVFGAKSDALVQSAGQLAAQFGLSAVGVPWFVTSGVTSFGSETENALNQGASYEEAGLSAAITAGAEILSEKMFGGDIFTKSGGLDIASKYLATGISNKVVQKLAKLGLDVTGEGIEEAVSQFFSRLGTSLYKEENLGEILFSEEALEEYLDSAIGGVALGGVMGGVNAVTSKGDYVTGLTKNETAVVEKVYKDALAEKEKGGKKVSAKDKADLYESIVRDMERGRISTDTIEEVLGGESYKSYKTISDSEAAITKEYEDLGNVQNATLKQKSRYAELEAQVKEISGRQLKNQAKQKLSQEVSELTKTDRLAESYRERARRGQAYEADLTKYDAKQQAVIQKAIDSGILNNTNRTHEFVDMVAKIAADKGVTFDFLNNEKLKGTSFARDDAFVNGYYDKKGKTIGVNIDSAKALNTTVGHEITHVLEGTELYNEFQKTVFAFAESKGELASRKEALSKLYAAKDVDSELAADLVGEYLFNDSDFISRLSVENRNVFQKLWDEVKYLCKVATAGSQEARELEKVKRAFEKAYREGDTKRKPENIGLPDVDAKYSLAGEKANLSAENRVALQNAKEMKAQGKSNEEIHKATGWYTQSDGKWRIEIPDEIMIPQNFSRTGLQSVKDAEADAEMAEAEELFKDGSISEGAYKKLVKLAEMTRNDNLDSGKLPHFLHAPKLYEAYPKLKETSLWFKKLSGMQGYTDSGRNQIVLDPDGLRDAGQTVREGLAHEIQHIIQHIEGFAAGSNPKDAGSYEAYRKAGGEIEARDVEDRLRMTPDERKANMPVQFSLSVTDKETIDFLENQEHIVTYKAMQVIDGKLYPPMAAKVKDENGRYQLTNPSQLGKWQQATEDPTNIKKVKNGVGYYTLNKGDGTSIDAAYNPYEHSSNLVLNDQFESAYRRDNLVVVECVIPVSEMSSGYKAQYAKDSTGVMDWKAGVVAGKIKDNKRQVYLSRYLKPVRILSDAEVAGKYKEILDGTGVSVPFNVVQPSLLAELEKAGVDIDYEGSPMYKANQKRAAEKAGAQYSLSDSTGRQLTAEQQEFFKDSTVRDADGNLLVMYHGTANGGSFTIFEGDKLDNRSISSQIGQGFYFTNAKNEAQAYTKNVDQFTGRTSPGKNPHLHEVYLNVKNPFNVKTDTLDLEAAKAVYLDGTYDWFFTNWIPFELNNRTVDGVKYTKADVESMSKEEKVSLYVDYLSQQGTKAVLQDMVRAFPYGGQSQLLASMKNRLGYDGIVEEFKPGQFQYAVFDSNQIKRIDNTNPTADPDIRYSLSDTKGREVSPAVANRFAKSKAVDEDGNLKVLYHGTAAGEFFTFDKAKGNVEGDYGSGFYFSDNEGDVADNYEGGGADFEIKVARLAEQIEADEDIDYAEAEKRARNELYKGSYKHEVYLNLENPATVGETILFDPDSYYSQYNEEDYDSYEDYESDVEQQISDDIDGILLDIERNVDVTDTDGIADIIWEAINEGGIELEILKGRLNALFLEDSNGNLVGNEIARQIIESLGYDGIIDPTVSGKWNMDIEAGTTHYIAFKPNQIKSVTNQNPTDNPDIRYSLSSDGKAAVVDGIAVAVNTADIMTSGEYAKPKDYMVQYSVSTTPAWKANYLAKNGDTPEAQAVANAVEKFTNEMVQDDAIRGYVPMGEYKYDKMGPLRSNMEYIWTFDMDTSCPRTFQFLNFRDAIQRTAGRYLTYNESINLLELMRAYGQQIPCCYCYVENKRVLLSASYNNFFGFRNAVMTAENDEAAAKVMYGYSEKKGLPDASKKAMARWRADLSYNPSVTDVWTATNTARNSVLNFLDGEMAAGNINAKTAQSKLNKMVLDRFGIADKGAAVEIEGFVKDWAYDTLANIPHIYNTDNNTDVSVVDERALALNHEALAYSKSASSAKSVENYVPYTDQLKNVSEEDREYIMGMGGIRKHSSNDFRMDYVQDYIMLYADLAAGKWTGHTYTKSADFTKVFACTNDRINMSVAFYEDADGNLRENIDEGASWRDVQQLRKAYKNVGSMAMVTSDNQLSYALNSDWVDMIIPFHASGLDKSVWYNLRMWNDYTSKQGERFYNAETMKQLLNAAGVEIPKGANADAIKALYEETFPTKHIYGKNGEILKPHFFPNDTYKNGQLVPGHHNNVETYFRLCAEYGVHPRFYGIKVKDTNGNLIDVTEHPSYLKLIKETSRTDTPQEVIQFNFGNYDDFLKMTPFEYAMQRMQEEAKNGGFDNTKADPYGVVNEFVNEYLNKDRPLGYLTDRAKETREILLEMSRESAKQQSQIVSDAQLSLSKADEDVAPTPGYHIYGKDLMLQPSADIAPVATPTVAKNETVAPMPVQNKEKPEAAPVAGKQYEAIRPDTEKQPKLVRAETAEKEEKLGTRAKLHKGIMDGIKAAFKGQGFDFDKVLRNAKNLSTFSTVDNTPQRVMEKSLGYKEGQILSDITVNRVAQNETEGTKWLNAITDRKNGLLSQLSKQYHIKPASKESAAAQMYAEGFYVNNNGDIIAYGDAELAQDFPDAKVQANIKGLAADPRIRQFYDETLAAINESRVRNAYPEIQRLENYFLHFRAQTDTFSRLGLPFNPNDIRAKDLPTDLNGVTADLKPGQPYFASAMHRMGKRTSFDLLGGLEKYAAAAKNQIYHIDDIQTLRALRNYIADAYGQAHGLENLDNLSEEEAQDRIEQVYGAHLSTFAKFLNEEANILAGKTALIDRGLEGIIGRRGITFLNTVNGQVGSGMVGYNISSALTNFLPVAQTFAKTNKADFVKAFAQTVGNRVGSIFGRGDDFNENSPVAIRRKGADRFYRTPWQKLADPGYALMGAVDSISTELIARTKYNEFVRKGMDSQQAHIETDKWVSRLMGDRSLGQQPQIFNSKMLGLVTKFQMEVRNQLDSQFYDTIQETKVSNEHIENALARNAKTAAKVASTFVQLAVVQHLFGKAFESVAGYNPAFDIIESLIKAFGWDDDEESEDTALDNIEQGFLNLLEDLPYASTFMDGGRIPVSAALPIAELVKGEDEWGNEKSRWKTLGEIAPYYALPAGYGQIKKTAQGLNMFSDDHPVAGSYTDSGNLRFPVEDTFGNRLQAGLFGQYANKNARDYFDNERSPLKEKQIQEYIDVDMPIRDYWEYREGLAKQDTLEDKFEYIADLDLPVEKKNILINNIVDRKDDVDMSNYDDFSGFEEFDWYSKHEEKYNFLQSNGVSYQQYKSSEDAKEKYDAAWAWYNNDDNAGKVTVSKVITDNVIQYREYTSALNDIRADKDASGKTINGSGKAKKAAYIDSLDLDYGQKMILYRTLFDSEADKDAYNADIVDYLSSRDDLSYDEIVTILEELDMKVHSDGRVTW